MAPIVYMTVGISGAGKSKFANYIKSALQVEEVNADEVRKELGDINDQSNNDKVWKIVNDRTTAILAGGGNVFLSNTNLHVKSYMDIRKKYPYNHIVLFLMKDSFDVELCQDRIHKDLERKEWRSNVPDEVVERQHENFLKVVDDLQKVKHNDLDAFLVNRDFVLERI